MEDALKALGHLALGSRLKRLGEQLQQQTQEMLESHGIALTTAHFPLLMALDRFGPMSVGGLVEALGIAQPGVTRFLRTLEAEGLVDTRVDAEDRRARNVRLTPAGAALLKRAKAHIWPEIEGAVRAAAAAPDGSLLEQIANLEEALSRQRLIARVSRRRKA